MRPPRSPRAVPESSWRIERAERPDPSTAVLALGGDLDLDAVDPATAVLARLEGEGPRLVVIDLHSVTFIDAFGVRLLTRAQERADAGGWTLVVVVPPPPADRVLRVLRLGERMNLSSRSPRGSRPHRPALDVRHGG